MIPKTDFPISEEKKVVLVCDDSKCCLQAMKRILTDRYHVITASSGYEAVSFASLYSPDIIILDIMMYGMTGFEVIKKLKKIGNTKYIPVIFLTGYPDAKYRDDSFALGAVEYMAKPFDLQLMIDAIERHTTDAECA